MNRYSKLIIDGNEYEILSKGSKQEVQTVRKLTQKDINNAMLEFGATYFMISLLMLPLIWLGFVPFVAWKYLVAGLIIYGMFCFGTMGAISIYLAITDPDAYNDKGK